MQTELGAATAIASQCVVGTIADHADGSFPKADADSEHVI